jgi:hypothetical protein
VQIAVHAVHFQLFNGSVVGGTASWLAGRPGGKKFQLAIRAHGPVVQLLQTQLAKYLHDQDGLLREGRGGIAMVATCLAHLPNPVPLTVNVRFSSTWSRLHASFCSFYLSTTANLQLPVLDSPNTDGVLVRSRVHSTFM